MTRQADSPAPFITGEAIAVFLRVKAAIRTVWKADDADYGFGVTQEGVASGKNVSVRHYEHGGSMKMTASEAITAGAKVYAAADGKIAASGTLVIGTALDAATDDGSVIEVLPHIGYQQSSSSSSSSSSSA